MNRHIIENHLLVSGSARRHDILALERRCREKGFTIERTGAFGIGVLSYFMLADLVRIVTRRDQEAADAEATGWQFETEGVGTFGELRPSGAVRQGTEVSLRLRSELVDDPEAWHSSLCAYIRNQLVYMPCRFEFEPLPGTTGGLRFEPGWCASVEEMTEVVHRSLTESVVKVPPLNSYQGSLATWSGQRDVAASAMQAMATVTDMLRWERREGVFAGNIARYRATMPYFRLPGGASLAYFSTSDDGSVIDFRIFGGGNAAIFSGIAWMSWCGVSVSAKIAMTETSTPPIYLRTTTIDELLCQASKFHLAGDNNNIRAPITGIMLETDWLPESASSMSVNRRELELSSTAQGAFHRLHTEVRRHIAKFCHERADSAYAFVNCAIAQTNPPSRRLIWPVWAGSAEVRRMFMEEVSFPALGSSNSQFEAPVSLEWEGRSVSVPAQINTSTGINTYRVYTWEWAHQVPDKVVCCEVPMGGKSKRYAVSLWERDPHVVGGQSNTRHVAQFPPAWKWMVGKSVGPGASLRKRTGWVLNEQNPFVQRLLQLQPDELGDISFVDLDPLPMRDTILSNPAIGAWWIASCIDMEATALWEHLAGNGSSFLRELWKALFAQGDNGDCRRELIVVRDGSLLGAGGWYDSRVSALGPGGWEVDTYGHSKELLPDAGEEWVLRWNGGGQVVTEGDG